MDRPLNVQANEIAEPRHAADGLRLRLIPAFARLRIVKYDDTDT
jgi:hypothetical protein